VGGDDALGFFGRGRREGLGEGVAGGFGVEGVAEGVGEQGADCRLITRFEWANGD
jgi:hypothetical protein